MTTTDVRRAISNYLAAPWDGLALPPACPPEVPHIIRNAALAHFSRMLAECLVEDAERARAGEEHRQELAELKRRDRPAWEAGYRAQGLEPPEDD